MRKLVYIYFHTNYFTEEPEEFLVFGFMVDDPTGSVIKADKDGDMQDFIEEFENDIIESTVDTFFEPDTEFWGGSVYEVDASQIEKIRSSVKRLYGYFQSIGGINGPLVESKTTEAGIGPTLEMIKSGELS